MKKITEIFSLYVLKISSGFLVFFLNCCTSSLYLSWIFLSSSINMTEPSHRSMPPTKNEVYKNHITIQIKWIVISLLTCATAQKDDNRKHKLNIRHQTVDGGFPDSQNMNVRRLLFASNSFILVANLGCMKAIMLQTLHVKRKM